MSLPDSSDTRPVSASAKAAAARRMLAELRQRIQDGDADLARILRDAETDPVLGQMRVSELLAALPTVEKAAPREVMTAVGIAPTRQVRSLTPRQRAALLQWFSAS